LYLEEKLKISRQAKKKNHDNHSNDSVTKVKKKKNHDNHSNDWVTKRTQYNGNHKHTHTISKPHTINIKKLNDTKI